MIGYKGFDKNFSCRGFHYKVGKTYKRIDEIKLGECGFHFCTNPLGVLSYYPPAISRFALVEANGEIIKGDAQCVASEIAIVKELTITELINAATNTCKYAAAVNTGDWSTATGTGSFSAAANAGRWSTAINTGCWSAAVNTGDWSAAIDTGNYSAAAVSGNRSIAIVTGAGSRAKGALGCWLVLAEWRQYKLVDVQAFKVDGTKIKPDVFYRLKDGKPVEADDD